MGSGLRPGPRNLLTDVPGLRVGNAHDGAARTGVTVVLADVPVVCACDVRGGGPGTRETDLLAPHALVETIDAIVLSGGSVYGLAAADAVVADLGAAGRGFRLNPLAPPAPIVPGAILFDLANGGDKAWGREPPYRRLGSLALDAAGLDFGLGTAGAGYGAQAGGLKGGLGSASLRDEAGVVVAALAAVNSFGSVVMPGERAFWAWPFEVDGEFGGQRPTGLGPRDADDWGLSKATPGVRENTTLGVIAVNRTLTPAQAQRLAMMAQDGLARSVRPVHAPFDGDVVFVLSTGGSTTGAVSAFELSVLGERAAVCLARAVARGVYEAHALPDGAPAWRDCAWS